VGNSEYLQVFEAVWSTVNENYFDPDFGGLDWDAVHEKYEPLISAAEDDDTLYQLLNQMLWELNVSHIGVGPVDVWPSVEPVAWENGEIGIDVRLLDDQVVITRVEAESTAEQAGLQPGFIIQSINATPIKQILTDKQEHLAPPYNEQSRTDILTRSLLSLIYGDPATCVSLAYLDGEDKLREGCIERIQRPREGNMGDILPPAYLEFESRRLESGIGYIRFNTFHPDLITDMVDAVASFQDSPGIIVDLRGNPGGDPITVEQLAGQFLDGETSLGSFTTRSGVIPRTFTGNNVFSGPLVILIDALSFSGSEYFSSGMQTLDRAVIIGERSPGGLSAMNVTTLPNGAILGCPIAQLITPDGKVLEGFGVIPDITVTLKRNQLLEGFDAQLQAAVRYIEEILVESSSPLRTPISIASSPGLPPVIDGTISPGEWDGSERELFSDGSELLLMRNGEYLYLGIRAKAPGMIVGNIFIEQNNQVSILHASAALGTAVYQKGSDAWQQSQDFSWSCRKTDNSEAALAERGAFLQSEGWVASNSRMGTPSELEYQVKIDGNTLHMAVIFLRVEDPDVKIPWPPDLEDDCIKPTEGELPINMEFSLEQWGMFLQQI
jgi:C-terminal processing protease CtpA/Prc